MMNYLFIAVIAPLAFMSGIVLFYAGLWVRDIHAGKRCGPLFHNWGDWVEIKAGESHSDADRLTGREFPMRRVGFWVLIRRECQRCKRVELRTVRS